jgi:negative regulator of flagellin synthesis FlgM
MTTTISNNGLPPFTPPTGNAGSGTPAAAGATVGTPSASGKADDQVKLTDSALALQQASRASDGAVVDQQKVDQIRQALADGSYQINPARIAERMLSLEQQLGGAGKA